MKGCGLGGEERARALLRLLRWIGGLGPLRLVVQLSEGLAWGGPGTRSLGDGGGGDAGEGGSAAAGLGMALGAEGLCAGSRGTFLICMLPRSVSACIVIESSFRYVSGAIFTSGGTTSIDFGLVKPRLR